MKVLSDILEPAAGDERTPPEGRRLGVLALTALGVVYGDIGTSPLYAVRECFHGSHPVPVTPANVLGVLSLITWSLVIVISVKYLGYVMRADNRGEGGILALMALIHPGDERHRGRSWPLVAMGLFGAALLYGDGTITPAISVLSAVEGLEVATTAFKPFVIPVTIAILLGLFVLQRRGTRGVGAVFGPVMGVWFVVIAALGLSGIVRNPDVLHALDPSHAVAALTHNGFAGFAVLGAVFLVVTGGEALYADIGHFGKRPIRLAWFTLVLPALLLNYYGQGALLMADTDVVRSPFYLLAPGWATYPLVLLATLATVIASQAIISGAFSLTRQAIQLGYSPRMKIEHTSAEEIGQVYMPAVNWALMTVTISLVVAFKRSTNLAAAYGVAVTTTMVITTLLAFVVARRLWGWSRLAAGAVTVFFLVPDLAFFAANMLKVDQGGWFPLAVAAVIFTLMSTWSRGRTILADRLRTDQMPLADLVDILAAQELQRVDGTAVFLSGSLDTTPTALLHHIKHNKVLHEQVLVVTVANEDRPWVPRSERVEASELAAGIYRVVAHYGFMQSPDVPAVLRMCAEHGLEVDPQEASYYLGRETLVPSRWTGLSAWRAKLFAFMSRNALAPTSFFGIPHNRAIELGAEVEL